MILSLPPTIQSETAAGGGGDGTHPPTSQSEAPPTHSSGKQKSKRTRTAYTQVQQDQLEMAYHANPYPDGIYRQKVSDLTGIPPDRIQVGTTTHICGGHLNLRGIRGLLLHCCVGS